MKLIGVDQTGVVLKNYLIEKNNSDCPMVFEVEDDLEVYPECTSYFADSVRILDQERFDSERKNKWQEWRLIRNNLLSESDWTRLDDVSLTAEKKLEWEEYRQALRDLIDETGNPFAVTWPEKP